MAESSSGNQDTQAGNNSVPKSSSSNSLRLTPSQALRRGNSSAGGSGNGSGGGNGNGSRSRSENTGGSTPKTRADSASNNGNKNNNNNNRRRRNNRNSNSNNKNKNNQNGPSPPFGERGETNEKQQQQQQRQRQRQRGNNKKGGKPNVAGGDIDANATPSQNNHNATDTTDLGNHNNNNNNNNNNPGENKGKKQRQRQRQRPKAKGKKGGGGNSNSNSNSNTEASASGDERGNAQSPAKPKKSRNRNNNNNKKKKKKNNNNNKYPWRRHIPEGTVDPITLEELDTLEYPPFALVADEPYIPVPEWPIPPGSDRAVRSDASPPQQNRTQQPNSGDDDNDDNYNDDDDDNDDDDAEDQNRQRLADQWGEFMLPAKETSTGAITTTTKQQQQQQQQSKGPALSERPLNLFDGRALAFYMVSQLQFIDPFTRRDLTRPELVNLDRYLDRYGSGNPNNRRNTNNNNNNNNKQARAKKLRVTDAYDAKGITLSSAGAAAATARGRADILQQTAQQLLDSLFAGPQQRQQESTTSLQEQYASLQRQERAVVARHERRFEGEPFGGGFGFGADASRGSDGGGGGGGGFVIIDDDENPELRGRGHDDFPSLGALPGAGGHAATFSSSSSSSSSLYSASHIAGQHGRGGTNLSAQGPGAFPSLPTPASALASASASAAPGTAAAAARTTQSHDSSSKKPPAKPSKTLSKISGIVKKTTSEERQRQWEARETARRKAMMSNLTLGMNHSLAGVDPSLPTVPTSSASVVAPVTDEQIQRNRAFAEALGVKPATQRHYASGWARPTTTSATTAATTAVTAFSTRSGDEHADELEAALYPDELILQARDTRMQFLLKLEKRWKTFLNDDAAASLPLNRMDRASRKFVHQYAEFWKLKTESFDPEPNRYIHCVKLLETRMPVPLLSEVARNWRGPAALPLPDATRTIASFLNSNNNINNINNSNSNNDHTSQQTAGQSSGSGLREVAKPMLRSATALSSSKGDLVAFGRAAFQNSRSDALRDKERPKMTLLPRSVPLELPPFEEQRKEQQEATLNIDEDLRKRRVLMEEKRQRERELEQKKRRALEDAFASDEDEDEAGRKTAGGSDDDSDWGDDQEALYNGSDEEE
eukprot:CAMPEP_0172382354 /NCGR_PEP_ID=MMETSP1061-20121228/302_1 /TAXON_ID=37318 /ORGANISM="Pseudo-nitzschia pungens, Strain cf. pungens" /LENGTH=1111 /DNA_ID=CAMNT_0013110199 /DNA_START=291 /DNA_END=3626 /DNA_ORIENTATION=-